MIEAAALLLSASLGAVVASYVTTAALRATDPAAPTGARSLCDGCRRPLGWAESLPIVSYAILRGRCRTCAASISPFHPAGEIVGAIVGACLVLAASDYRIVGLAVMAAILLGASVIDVRTRILPDLLIGIVAIIAALLALNHGRETLLVGLAAAVISLGIFGGLAWLYRRRRGHVGLGMGDVKLFAALALWLGLATPWMVFIASALGLAIMALVRQPDRKIPFGPMIAVAGFAIGLLLEAGIWPAL